MKSNDTVTYSVKNISITTSAFDYSLSLDELIKNLELTLTFPIHGLTAIIGVVTNLLSMVILSRLGLKSSMWVGGFALSLTDFFVTCLQIAVTCCYLLNYVYPESNVDMVMLGVFALGSFRYAGFYISMWITTVISVERCFCVVFPFKVKRLFTRSRCVFTIIVIYCVYIGLISPVYIFDKIDWIDLYSGEKNVTIKKKVLTAVYSEDSLSLEIIIDAIGAVALSVTSQTILIICTIWMTYALKASSTIRQHKDNLPESKIYGFDLKKSELSIREIKLIKVVMSLACVLTFCNIPRYVVLAVYLSVPGLTGDEYKALSTFMWDISDFFGTLNCSSNFFVYWIVNSHFRNTLTPLFRSVFQIRNRRFLDSDSNFSNHDI